MAKERPDNSAPRGTPQRPLEQITWSSIEAQRKNHAMDELLSRRSPVPMITQPERPVQLVPLE
jgi:hypothetical protein